MVKFLRKSEIKSTFLNKHNRKELREDMGATYNVSPDVLMWVYKKAQNSIIPLKSTPLIESWVKGSKIPTFNQIEDVSNETRIPLGYFFLNMPPEEKIPLLQFRTIKNEQYAEPSRNLIDTIQDMEMIIDWTRNFLKDNHSNPNSIVGSQKDTKNHLSIASYIRSILCLDIDWFKNSSSAGESFRIIREQIENVGVIVMQNGTARNNTRRPLNVEEFRAFTIIDDYAPLIFINAVDSPNAKLFSLFHELVHVCLGVNSLYNGDEYMNVSSNNEIETLCNAVAADLLVPTELFKERWEKYKADCLDDTDVVSKMAGFFKCSQVVIARKAKDQKFITKNKYQEIEDTVRQQYLATRKKQASLGGDYYTTMMSRIDQRFFNMLIESVFQGKTQYTEACQLTHTNRVTFSELAERISP